MKQQKDEDGRNEDVFLRGRKRSTSLLGSLDRTQFPFASKTQRKTNRLFTDMTRKKENAHKYLRLKVTLSPECPPDVEQQ